MRTYFTNARNTLKEIERLKAERRKKNRTDVQRKKINLIISDTESHFNFLKQQCDDYLRNQCKLPEYSKKILIDYYLKAKSWKSAVDEHVKNIPESKLKSVRAYRQEIERSFDDLWKY